MKEALLALALLAFGLFCLPALVYLVGQRIIGPYEGGGLYGFYEAIGFSLAAGRPAAWLLALSPYLVVQLVRFGAWLRRRRRTVT